jgi:C-terminal processing protease CtpA/Prc
MTTEIRDGHGFIRTENNPINKYKYTPFYCIGLSDGYFINVVFQDSLQSIDLKRMDRVISINGDPVENKIRQIGNFLSTSNDYYLSKATHYLRITNQKSITLTIERDGQLLTRTYSTINRETLKSRFKTTKSDLIKRPYSFLKDSISGKVYCYINMGGLKRSDINREFKQKLMFTDYLIIDSRNYPNWTLIKLSKLLINGRTKFAKFINMDLDYPGSFKWTESQTIGNKMKGYEGNIFVLVDYNTMSQSEYTVMAFQQHQNTVVLGGQTAGADGNISETPLPFGIKYFFFGLGVFYPDETTAQQVGVKRDYELMQNSNYLQGQDLILEKALELIRNK